MGNLDTAAPTSSASINNNSNNFDPFANFINNNSSSSNSNNAPTLQPQKSAAFNSNNNNNESKLPIDPLASLNFDLNSAPKVQKPSLNNIQRSSNKVPVNKQNSSQSNF